MSTTPSSPESRPRHIKTLAEDILDSVNQYQKWAQELGLIEELLKSTEDKAERTRLINRKSDLTSLISEFLKTARQIRLMFVRIPDL